MVKITKSPPPASNMDKVTPPISPPDRMDQSTASPVTVPENEQSNSLDAPETQQKSPSLFSLTSNGK